MVSEPLTVLANALIEDSNSRSMSLPSVNSHVRKNSRILLGAHQRTRAIYGGTTYLRISKRSPGVRKSEQVSQLIKAPLQDPEEIFACREQSVCG